MNRQPRDPAANRRDFLKRLAAAGGLAAVTVGARSSQAADFASPVQPAEPGPHGYRLTPHVAKYYGKARF